MFWLAFTTGLFGSLHCVGMCGPIALALPLSKENQQKLFFNNVRYNLGRIITYSILGIFIGLIGEGFGMAGLQKGLSVIIGLSLLLVVLFSVNVEKQFIQIPLFSRLYFWLKIQLAKFLKKATPASVFSFGLLNGLLPCGLVYVGLAGALTTGSPIQGAIYMALFGLGTFPLMFLTVLLGNKVSVPVKATLRKGYPAFLSLLALWFIYRGVYFYLPPNFQISLDLLAIPMCH